MNEYQSLDFVKTLFLQATTCAKGCTGCYLKAHEEKFGNDKMSYPLWSLLMKDMTSVGGALRPDQITFALDTLPNGKNLDLEEEMLMLFMDFCAYTSPTKNKNRRKHFEAHITVNCINDLRDYAWITDSGEKFLHNDGITLLSISNINKPEDVQIARKLFPNVKINWNIMSSSFAHMTNEKIISILQSVDQAYLLLHKAPLGMHGHDFLSMKLAMEKINEIEQLESEKTHVENEYNSCALPSITSKIHVDGCIKDNIRYAKLNFGCSSNVSRFQIWPNGRVTGCAYNSQKTYGKTALNIEDIYENIREAKKRYEFRDCTILKELKRNRNIAP